MSDDRYIRITLSGSADPQVLSLGQGEVPHDIRTALRTAHQVAISIPSGATLYIKEPPGYAGDPMQILQQVQQGAQGAIALSIRKCYDYVSGVNRLRSAFWHNDGDPWTLADWSNALGGEWGELANIVKKIRRVQTGAIHREQESDLPALVDAAVLEVADVAIYLDLLLEQLNPDISLYDVIAAKFNLTSERFGFEQRLPVEE